MRCVPSASTRVDSSRPPAFTEPQGSEPQASGAASRQAALARGPTSQVEVGREAPGRPVVPGPYGLAEWRRGRGRAGRAAWCARGMRACEQVTGPTPVRQSRGASARVQRTSFSHRPRVDLEPLLLGYDTTSISGAYLLERGGEPLDLRVFRLRAPCARQPSRSRVGSRVQALFLVIGEESCHSLPARPAPIDIAPVVACRMDRATRRSAGGRRVRSMGVEPRSPHAVRRTLHLVYAARRGDQSR